jgi:hypothetical protein
MHTPPHTTSGSAHGMHVPAAHFFPGSHMWKQLPQFFESVSRFAHSGPSTQAFSGGFEQSARHTASMHFRGVPRESMPHFVLQSRQ